MTCERYWREGIVLVERGLPDPHRADCADCLQAHESRHELVRALPEIGAGYTGDPHWQANVWRRIERETASRPRWRWWLEGTMVMATACAILLWLGIGGETAIVADNRPSLEFIKQTAVMRSYAHTGEGIRVTVEEGDEIRIYRDEQLELQCPAEPRPACTRDARGFVVEMVFELPGAYQVIVAKAGVGGLSGELDHDLATLELSGKSYVRLRRKFSVR